MGGILHETNTFAHGETTLEDFRLRMLLRGDHLLDAVAGAPNAPGGAVAEAVGQAHLEPLLLASATPGPPVAAATFDSLAGALLDRLRWQVRRWPGIDGMVLFLHGAMVTTNDDDPDGTLLARARSIVGPDRPIVVVIDSHANLSHRMVQAADAIVAYQTYPHVDTAARGREAVRWCLDLIESGQRPVVTHRTLPVLMPLPAQRTDPESPFWPVVERATVWRNTAGIRSLSLVPGFPYADIAGAGASVLAYTSGPNATLGDAAADDLAARWWSQRETFSVHGVAPGDWPATVSPPVVLAEISDNPGAGGTGDGTHLLRYMLQQQLPDAALATLYDPEAVAACWQAGPAATLHIGIGGKRDATSGEPVTAAWEVIHLGNGSFVNEGAMATGARGQFGRTATVRSGALSVMLSERRAQTLDPGVFRAGGIEPERCRWLAVKSSVHYRAGFRAVAGSMIDVECAGLSPSALATLPFVNVRRPMVPLDPEGPTLVTGQAGLTHA